MSISVYVTLASISQGYKAQLDRSVGLTGVDAVVQARNASGPTTSRIGAAEVARLEADKRIGAVTPLVAGSLRAKAMGVFILVGLPDGGGIEALTAKFGASVVEGRPHNPGAREAMVGERAARKHRLEKGSEFTAENGEKLTITGIYRMGVDVLDGAVVTGVGNARILLGKPEGEYSIVLLKAAENSGTNAMIAAVNDSNPGLWAAAGEGLSARIRSMTFVDAFIKVVRLLSFLFAGLLLANTLLMALSERTREIGILMVIGWSRARVVAMVLIEGTVLCALGACTGYALTFAILPLLELLPAIGAGWLPTSPTAEILPDAAVLAACTGAVSGLFPAVYATRLKPVTALQSE